MLISAHFRWSSGCAGGPPSSPREWCPAGGPSRFRSRATAGASAWRPPASAGGSPALGRPESGDPEAIEMILRYKYGGVRVKSGQLFVEKGYI